MNRLLLAVAAMVLATIAVADDCNPANICFAMDESGSISSSDFTTEKNVVNEMAKSFADQATTSSFSAVGFSSSAEVVSQPTTDVNAFQNAVSANTQSSGGTAIGAGLSACNDLIGSSLDPRIVVLLTDGIDGGVPSGESVAEDMKADGIIIVTIGIGSSVNQQQLSDMATRPEYFIYEQDFNAMQDDIDTLVQTLCETSQLLLQNICGTDWNDAYKCQTACRDDGQCPSGEKCWASIPCPSMDPLPAASSQCGTDYDDAAKCETSCASDADCPTGERCWASITCSAASAKATSKTGAKARTNLSKTTCKSRRKSRRGHRVCTRPGTRD